MIDPKVALDILQSQGIAFFAGVPDSLLKDLCACIDSELSSEQHVITANEGGAVAVAAGHHLATGHIPCVYMQNSGLGNTINPLLSLADSEVYSIPLLLVIGWRGEAGVPDEPQHVKQGPVTPLLLEAMDIPYTIVPDTTEAFEEVVRETVAAIKKSQSPQALLVRKGTFGSYKNSQKDERANGNLMSREVLLRTVLDGLSKDTVYVGTTGKLSRELFELREERSERHEKDFLTVGSMGHASQIALGLAQERPNKSIVCLDGDGAALMHLGGLATIGCRKPKNYIHIIVNNGVHESVGGQCVTGSNVDYAALAKNLGYANAFTVDSEESLKNILTEMDSCEKPILIDCKVHTGSRGDLGRPTTTPQENKVSFMKNIQQ